MTKQELLREIRVKFLIKLQSKTGWGRNEVLKIYDESVTEVLYQILQEKEFTRKGEIE